MDANTNATSRIASIDIMRGVVILLMMLDHVRERFFMHTRVGDPISDHIEAEFYFTRYVTHFCAPIFILLAGVSAWLYANPSANEYRSPAGFLFKRGLVIIGIEVVLYYLVWVDSYPTFLFLQVLFAIGACMILLALVCRLNYRLLGALGLLIVFGHNLLEPIDFSPNEFGYLLWSTLLEPNELGQIGPLTISLSYPVLPWFGVILLGYFAGPLFAQTVTLSERRKLLLSASALCLILLLLLRGTNFYGETLPWTIQGSASETVMSFLNFTKYPPSLNFLLITVGIGLMALVGIESMRSNRLLDAIQTFGSVPMFIYVVHLYVLLAAYWLLYSIFGPTHGDRFALPTVSWIWIGAAALVALHYPLAKYFSNFKHKEKHNRPWLSYL